MPKLSDVLNCPKKPDCKAIPDCQKEFIVLDYEIKLITPLFGGGVDAGTPDEKEPIRATSIRGHLQFWWRAIYGAQYETSKQLFEAHEKIWGSTNKPSAVEVEVMTDQNFELKPCAEYKLIDGKYSSMPKWHNLFSSPKLQYVLFPFSGENPTKDKSKRPALFIENITFHLIIKCPQLMKEQIEHSVKAWVNFGGIGTRTRRGCGSISCKELTPHSIDDFKIWFLSILKFQANSAREWPTISSSLFYFDTPSMPFLAWEKAIQHYQEFRQGPGFARNKGDKWPGRSHFPEPEIIRNISGCRMKKHQPMEFHPHNFFPRAEFGLPIIFHFKDQNFGEPLDTTLNPSADKDGQPRDRMASPLILKPLALQNGKAIPIVLCLFVKPLTGVVLKGPRIDETATRGALVRDQKLSKYCNSPLNITASGSAIEAFLKFAQSKGFKEACK